MIQLTINNKKISVAPGATILKAAESCGIKIPTLCHINEFPPKASCMMCAVKDSNTGKIIPSCESIAESGMVIDTNSADVMAMRKQALELLISEHKGECEAPCERTCPLHFDIPDILRFVREGNPHNAEELINKKLPLSGAICESCLAPCEKACRRKRIDQSVAIKDIILLILKNTNTQNGPHKHDVTEIKENMIEQTKKKFHSLFGKTMDSDIKEWMKGVNPENRYPDLKDINSINILKKEAARCLRCGCARNENCGLRDLATEYNADSNQYSGEQIQFSRKIFNDFIIESGKCIKCGICVRISKKAEWNNGFTFLKRGFDLYIGLPFDMEPEPDKREILLECVNKCPTGALSINR